MFFRNFLIISPCKCLEKTILKFRRCIFRNFHIISPCKWAGPFIWINLNLHQLGMICAKFGWNWPSGSGKYYKIFVNVFTLFCYVTSKLKMIKRRTFFFFTRAIRQNQTNAIFKFLPYNVVILLLGSQNC